MLCNCMLSLVGATMLSTRLKENGGWTDGEGLVLFFFLVFRCRDSCWLRHTNSSGGLDSLTPDFHANRAIVVLGSSECLSEYHLQRV